MPPMQIYDYHLFGGYGLVSTDNFSLTKYVCRRKICSSKLNSVAKFHCQISVTKVSELSSISNLCCV